MMATKLISLADAPTGSRLILSRLDVQGGMRRRLLDLGFVPGNEVDVVQRSPLGDPIAYRVSNTMIALRREESSLIFGELERSSE